MTPNALTVPRFWDKTSSISRKSYPTPWLCRIDYEKMKLFHPFLESKKGQRLIELGCGDSYWLAYFAKIYGYQISGIDFSEARLKSSGDKLISRGVNYDFICDDFTNIPDMWVGKFDIVYSNGVLEHFSSPSDIANVFARYLKPDGLMITTVPHLQGFWGKLGERLSKEVDSGYVRMGLKDVIEAHQQAGLKVVFASYFRWADCSVLNYESLPTVLTKFIYGVVSLGDVVANACLMVYRPKWLFDKWPGLYSDMVVVARL